MLQSTKGIVLRRIKYSETSIICSIFTSRFGLQSYMVKGIRKAPSRANHLQSLSPLSVLDMVVYHKPGRSLQMIKECSPALIYTTIYEDVLKNSVGIFAMELLSILLYGQESQEDLYEFSENFLYHLDIADPISLSNLPIYFLIQSARFSGYYIHGKYNEHTSPLLDLHDGRYTRLPGNATAVIEGEYAALMSQFNSMVSLEDTSLMRVSIEKRRTILSYFLVFLQLHLPHYRELKTLPILTSLMH
jgi:DNA repair protein RecO (recombination protein O)